MTYAEAGVSVTITSLTNLVSFMIGAAANILAVRLFCVYTGNYIDHFAMTQHDAHRYATAGTKKSLPLILSAVISSSDTLINTIQDWAHFYFLIM